jgi:hypothetical protein
MPLTLPPDVAGALLGLGREASYQAIKNGTIPKLPGGGRIKVPTAGLELVVGRRLTVADIKNALAQVEPKRQQVREYMGAYRAAHAKAEGKTKKKETGKWLMQS